MEIWSKLWYLVNIVKFCHLICSTLICVSFFSNPRSESSTRLGNLICSTALCISGSHSQSIQAKNSKAKCTQNANTERPYVTRNFLGYANMDMDMDMHRAFYGYCTKAEFLFGNLSFYHNLLISKQKTRFYQIWHSHVSNVKYTNTEYANTQIQSAQKIQHVLLYVLRFKL